MRRLLAKAYGFVVKNGPVILEVVGVGCIVGGTALACKATLEAEDILEEHNKSVESINKVVELSESGSVVYTDDQRTHDKVVVYAKTLGKFVKLYLPATLTITTGIAALLAANGIISKRLAAAVAACEAINTSFNDYRSNVKDIYGEEVDARLMHIAPGRTFEGGVNPELERIRETIDKEDFSCETIGCHLSAFAKCYGEAGGVTSNWVDDPIRNLATIVEAENYANSVLKYRGYFTVNDMYKCFGFKPTKAGMIMGWVWNGDKSMLDADGKLHIISFLNRNDSANDAFMRGWDSTVWLDPNWDGKLVNLLGEMNDHIEYC